MFTGLEFSLEMDIPCTEQAKLLICHVKPETFKSLHRGEGRDFKIIYKVCDPQFSDKSESQPAQSQSQKSSPHLHCRDRDLDDNSDDYGDIGNNR